MVIHCQHTFENVHLERQVLLHTAVLWSFVRPCSCPQCRGVVPVMLCWCEVSAFQHVQQDFPHLQTWPKQSSKAEFSLGE